MNRPVHAVVVSNIDTNLNFDVHIDLNLYGNLNRNWISEPERVPSQPRWVRVAVDCSVNMPRGQLRSRCVFLFLFRSMFMSTFA